MFLESPLYISFEISFWSIYCQTLMAKGREWYNKIEKNKKKKFASVWKKRTSNLRWAQVESYFYGRTSSSSSMSRPLFVCFLLYWMWCTIVQQLYAVLFLYKQFIISIIEWNRLNGKFDVFLVWWWYESVNFLVAADGIYNKSFNQFNRV